MVAITSDVVALDRGTPTRRAGWLLIAGMAVSILVMLLGVLVGGDLQDYGDEIASAAGKAQDELTDTETALIANRYPVRWAIYAVATLLPLAVLTYAIYALRSTLHAPQARRWLNLAWWAALAMLAVAACLHLLLLGLIPGPDDLPPLVQHLDLLSEPADLAIASFGMAAIVCLGLAFRSIGLAPRLSLVVIGLSTLAWLLGVVFYVTSGGEESMEADIALIPAVVLGIGLLLAARKSTAAEG